MESLRKFRIIKKAKPPNQPTLKNQILKPYLENGGPRKAIPPSIYNKLFEIRKCAVPVGKLPIKKRYTHELKCFEHWCLRHGTYDGTLLKFDMGPSETGPSKLVLIQKKFISTSGFTKAGMQAQSKPKRELLKTKLDTNRPPKVGVVIKKTDNQLKSVLLK